MTSPPTRPNSLTMMTATMDGHSQSHELDFFSGVAAGAAMGAAVAGVCGCDGALGSSYAMGFLLYWLSLARRVQCAHQDQHGEDGGGTRKGAKHSPLLVEHDGGGGCIPQRRAGLREPPIREQLRE